MKKKNAGLAPDRSYGEGLMHVNPLTSNAYRCFCRAHSHRALVRDDLCSYAHANARTFLLQRGDE